MTVRKSIVPLAVALGVLTVSSVNAADVGTTFTYQGDKFTLKGFNLQGLFIKLGLKQWQHLREYNPDYNETTKEELKAQGKPCIEELSIEDIG